MNVNYSSYSTLKWVSIKSKHIERLTTWPLQPPLSLDGGDRLHSARHIHTCPSLLPQEDFRTVHGHCDTSKHPQTVGAEGWVRQCGGGPGHPYLRWQAITKSSIKRQLLGSSKSRSWAWGFTSLCIPLTTCISTKL